MCDYSLEHVESRKAEHGERLVVTQFTNSLTRGFAAVGNPNVAVCLRPGTELAFEGELIADHPLGLYERRRLKHNTAVFRQINLQSPYEHHDALELPDGKTILLTRLSLGQIATVLQLPVDPEVVKEEVIAEEPKIEVPEGVVCW